MRRCLLLLLTCFPLAVPAHESRPAYLDLQEYAPERYNVVWKVPAVEDRRFRLMPALPEHCVALVSGGMVAAGNAFVERGAIDCAPAGLAGAQIAIRGLEASIADVLVRIQFLDGRAVTQLLQPNRPAFVVPEAQSRWQVLLSYLRLGIEHILLGVDHLLFVLGLLLLVVGWAALVKTITSFTVAHSITLAAAALGVVAVPQAPVEAVIALSILFLAVEIARHPRGRRGLVERRPWLVAFLFGLLHGLGFAGALNEVGLPDSDVPLALLGFNLGVEAGQLLFVAAALAVLRVLRNFRMPAWLRALPVYGIGSLAAFWCVQRIAAF